MLGAAAVGRRALGSGGDRQALRAARCLRKGRVSLSSLTLDKYLKFQLIFRM